MKAFISYSHKDKEVLGRFHTHLAMLRKQGKISAWFDREILAGDDIDEKVAEKLEACDLFLALVSPDFLDSNYCYEKEMGRALERHKKGEIRVVPIIIEPCDWETSPLGGLKALPNDGVPVSTFPNQNIAFKEIVSGLRVVVDKQESNKNSVAPSHQTHDPSQSRTYKIKRDFDDIDRAEFRELAFSIMRDFLKKEIEQVNQQAEVRARFIEIGPLSYYCTIINKARSHGTSHVTVHSRAGMEGLADIYFSHAENAPKNTANGGFNIEADDYTLFLQPIMFMYTENRRKLSPQKAAEIIWIDLLERAGVTHA